MAYKVDINGTIFQFENRPTDQDIDEAYAQAFPQKAKIKSTEEGSLVFDGLKDNKQYVADLKAQYKADTGKDFDGNIEDLIEKSFEDWNMTEFNLGKGAYDVGRFALMDEEEAARNLRLYDVYSKTAATGEGSRSGWEQFKGVASAIATDPTTYLSFGLGKAATTTGTREATKFGIRKALQSAARPAGVGAGYAAIADTEHQLQQMALGGQDEFSVGELAESAATGAVLTPLAKAGLTGIAKTPGAIKSGFNKLTSKPLSERGQGLKEVAVRTMGGEQVAEAGVVKEGSELLTSGTGGREEAVSLVSQTFQDAYQKSLALFHDKFKNLGGFSGINKASLQKKIDDLDKAGVPKAALDKLQLLVDNIGSGKGQTHPTDAARRFRSILGKMVDDTNNTIHPLNSFNERFRIAYKKMRADFYKGADQAGKGKIARQLDKEYEDFVGVVGNKNVKKILENPTSAAQDVIASILEQPQKAPIRLQEFLGTISRLAKSSNDPNLLNETKRLMGQTLAAKLFKGNGEEFQKYLREQDGKKVLVEIFGETLKKNGIQPKDQMKLFTTWETILKNTKQNKGASTFWPRLLAQTLPIGAGASAFGTFGAVGGFIGFQALLRSKAFQKAAMNLFAKDGTPKQGAVKIMESELKKAGMPPSKIQEFMDRATGAIAEVGTFRMTGEQ